MASSVAIGMCFAIGTVLRLALFRSSAAGWLAERTEISNSLTSWVKAMEGVALAENDISPYNGDLFHETPLMLRFLSLAIKILPKRIHYLFVVIDLLSGLAVVSIGKHFSRYLLKKQVKDVKSYAIGVDKIILKKDSVDAIQLGLVAAHFLNPYSIAVCVGKSTAVVNNLFIFLSFVYMLQGSSMKATFLENLHNQQPDAKSSDWSKLKEAADDNFNASKWDIVWKWVKKSKFKTIRGKEMLCCLAISFASYQSLYPIMLLVPAAIYFQGEKSSQCNKRHQVSSSIVGNYGSTVTLGLLFVTALFVLSYFMEGSLKFLYSTTGFILGVPDLTPNLGVFWYFFTEMFEHFRPFFICVFQINAFLYTVPLAVKLRDHPVFMAYVLVALMSIFKSYPSYADVAVFITLLPMWKHVFQYMRNTFIVTNMFVACTVLSPILWHLWIYAGSANANFYFAIALTFLTAQIFLVTDLLFGFLRREFDLKNGLKHKLEDGNEAQVILD